MVDGYAHLKPSSVINSYSNGFKKSVFLFPGKPKLEDIIYNMKVKQLLYYKVIHIPPEECKCLIENNLLRTRSIDNAIIHKGWLNQKATTMDLSSIINKDAYAYILNQSVLSKWLNLSKTFFKTYASLFTVTAKDIFNIKPAKKEQVFTELNRDKPLVKAHSAEKENVVLPRRLQPQIKDIIIKQYHKEFPAIKHISPVTAKRIYKLNLEHGHPLTVKEIKSLYKELGKGLEYNNNQSDVSLFKELQNIVNDFKHAQLTERNVKTHEKIVQKHTHKTKNIEMT